MTYLSKDDLIEELYGNSENLSDLLHVINSTIALEQHLDTLCDCTDNMEIKSKINQFLTDISSGRKGLLETIKREGI